MDTHKMTAHCYAIEHDHNYMSNCIPKFQCKMCERVFVKQTLLDSHKTMHQVYHTCEYCLQRFSKKKELVNHFLGNYLGICEISIHSLSATIETITDNQRDLNNPIVITPLSEDHTDKPSNAARKFTPRIKHLTSKITCHRCNKRLSIDVWNHHQKLCTATKNIRKNKPNIRKRCEQLACTFCGKLFSSLFIARHEASHRAHHNSVSYKCKVCQRVLRYKTLIAKHKKYCRYCVKCGCAFSRCGNTYTSSSMCFKCTDQQKGPFICHLCGSIYDKRSTLNGHLLRVHNIRKLPTIECHICHRQIGMSNIKKHINHHQLPKPDSRPKKKRLKKHIICDICGHIASSRTNLKSHVLCVHTKSYKCNICEKSYGKETLLEGHMRKHSGLKPFRCTLCIKVYTTEKSLGAHIRTKH